ncbi:MAG TPA: type II toxin-antitoxin system RelE/ParE family toxin, partial [Aequorivita sp.]|nr:type II toxin-antitoxin system RelE/ParE family toxin [Aequorivita sp.]
ASMIPKILRILTIIDDLEVVPEDLQDLVFLRPHPLKGNLSGFWALDISGNWRIIFRFDNTSRSAFDLDFIDYH